jgi:peptidoglycan/xylan/chitin deacetylase (PgdA/CDA1 family)
MWIAVRPMADRLLVLAWHAVDTTWAYACRPGSGVYGLARRLERLRQVANVVPLELALEALGNNRPLPPRAVALTFDDGYRDNLNLGVPLLEELELPATFFLVPGILSGEVEPWWEVLGWAFARATKASVTWRGRPLPTRGNAGRAAVRQEVERLKALDRVSRDRKVAELCNLLEPEGQVADRSRFLNWPDARELVRRGFSVGSHSLNHAILSREAASVQLADLVESRRVLEAELDLPVRLLAYPNGKRGDYDATTMRLAQDAGYSHSLSMLPGVNNSATPAHEVRRVVLEPQQGFSATVARRVTRKFVGMARHRLATAGEPQRLGQSR